MEAINDLCLKGSNSIVVNALIDNRKCVNTHTWSTYIKQLLSLINRCDIWDRPNLATTSTISNIITSGLNNIYDALWLDIIRLPQGKLRTYALFKREFSLENSAVLLSKPLRSAFCKLRISAHTLMIERGRYFSPKLPADDGGHDCP